MTKKYLAIPALFALALAWFVAAPGIAVHQISTAGQARDAQALAEYVDFESVRASLTEQINALVPHRMAGDGDGARKPPSGAGTGYRGMGRFAITSHANHGDAPFVPGHRGLGWKPTGIILPPR
ncbi:MAG: DUF2939 domain-containing protein [Burkholderiales bacterium]|nr:DUF2939 domain-containing protein [Burkholderiales bacterium]